MAPYAIWLIVGVVALILELMLGTMFLIWVACGCFVAAAVGWLASGVPWAPWAAFVVSTPVLLYVGRRWSAGLHAGDVVPSNVDSLVGQEGVVLEAIDPVHNTGRVRVGSDEWRARSDQRFEESERVRVESVQGTTLMVGPVESESRKAPA